MSNKVPAIAIAAMIAVSGCATTTTIKPHPDVELARFMGDWYVIGNIPTPPEREAYNPVEHYDLDADGKVRTTFQYRKGGFDAPLKTMHPVASVRPGTNNAVWGMQFVWPIKAEYVIAYVDPGYTQTVIARSKRDYAWIMARTPTIPQADFDRLKQRLVDMGYSLEHFRVVPQQWPETGPTPRAK